IVRFSETDAVLCRIITDDDIIDERRRDTNIVWLQRAALGNPFYLLDCVLLSGTTADEDGNITLEDEAFPLDVLAMAQAGRNSGGIVVVQVK
ncbi:hypothetical protein ACC702_38400, partial [Rhizobium ruizarguesonis]